MFIDIFFLVLMLLACVKGYSKGLIIALFSVVGLIAGLAAALKLSAYAAGKLSGTFDTAGKWLPVISFVLVFVIVVFLVSMAGKLLQKSVEMVMLGWLNRIAGIILYALLYTLVFSVFLFYAVQLKIISAETVQASRIYPYIQPLGPWLMDSLGNIIPVFKNMFGQLQDFFGKIPESSPANPGR